MRLAHYQNGAPPHQDVTLAGGMPATMYLPGTNNQPGPDNPFFDSFPKTAEAASACGRIRTRFSSDRVNSSALARRIAQNG